MSKVPIKYLPKSLTIISIAAPILPKNVWLVSLLTSHGFRELSKRGAERVIMAVTDVELGQDVAMEVRGEINGDVAVEYCDMASIKSVRKFCTKVLEHESKIHILINHASVMW